MSPKNNFNLQCPIPKSEYTYVMLGHGGGGKLTKQLIDLMEGEIGIESKLGEGTRVYFSIPVAEIPVSDVENTHRGQALKTRRVLVVNDNARISRVICRNLNSWGMQCESVRFSSEVFDLLAVAKSTGQPFDGAIEEPDARGIYMPNLIGSGCSDANLRAPGVNTFAG